MFRCCNRSFSNIVIISIVLVLFLLLSEQYEPYITLRYTYQPRHLGFQPSTQPHPPLLRCKLPHTRMRLPHRLFIRRDGRSEALTQRASHSSDRGGIGGFDWVNAIKSRDFGLNRE
jgi:hypothetical protein